MAAGAGEMMNTLRWALFPYLVYIVLRGVLAATGHARWTLGVLLAAILFNAVAGWALIFGNLGMPALGLAGAGMASALSSLGLAAGVIVILIRHPALASLRLLAGPRVTDLAGLVTIWRLGLPIAVAMAFEMGIFYAAMLMVGAVGPDALAAHAIAMQIVSICFMLPFGFGQAATVRVGHAFGAGDALLAQRAATSARVLGLAAVTITSLATVAFPAIFLGLFVDADSPTNAGIVETGSAMLRIAALFLFASATQTIAAGALRGLQDTRTPMLIAAAGYWGVGLPAALLFGFPLGYGGPGIWGGLTLGLAVVAVLMVLRWRRLVGRLAFQVA
jgi:MATE family multidrug resistance protein